MTAITKLAPVREARLEPFGDQRRRLVTVPDLELRQADDDDDTPAERLGFRGHAAVFGEQALIRGWWMDWIESIEPGAFRKTIKEADVRMLINHDENLVLARNRAGTLKLAEDSVGLLVEAEMAPTSYARDLAVSLERRDIDQMSFAFRVVKEEWNWDSDPAERTLTELELFDVSVVTFPAYVQTDAALRGQALDILCRSMGWQPTQRDAFLRQLASGQIDPLCAPDLEAAGEALRRLAHAHEPVMNHSARRQALLRRTEQNRYLDVSARKRYPNV